MKRNIIIVTIIYLIVLIWAYPVKENNNNEVIVKNYNKPNIILVEIEGAVVFPGIYTFYDKVILSELIAYAGGLLEDADTKSFNQNKTIDESSSIFIESINNKEDDKGEIVVGVYNINTISFGELIKIPSVSERIAANIIIYREKHGSFTQIEQLLNVKWIGSSTFEKISKYFTIN